jgi:L-ascorbate metabolism protein UlaG (beta-lactamase superfamily)
MSNELLYLKPNVQVEPLVDQWYAWAHLIPPATAARNLTYRHLKIMESYINAPRVHASAVSDPKMLGGPFIDYKGSRVAEIRELRDKTRSRRHLQLVLSQALSDLDELLRSQAQGFSLEPLYSLVPDALRGYVELVYDLNNHPSFRLFESLLYRSGFYDSSNQSLMLSLIGKDDRPFILSTPRLEEPDAFHLHLPFASPLVDALFELKSCPKRWENIEDMFSVDRDTADLFKTFLTTTPPDVYRAYNGKGARWRYFGHACILVEAMGLSFLLDPVLSYTYESDVSRYTYQDLPDVIDYVLITHNHQDHVMFETLLQLRHKVANIIVPRSGSGSLQDPSLKLLLRQVGFRNVVEVSEMESIDHEGCSVMGIPFLGEHADLNIPTKMAYLIRIGGHSLLFASDSCNIDPVLYRHVRRAVGEIEALFLGMECDGAPLTWIYGPLLTRPLDRGKDESRRFAGSNYEQALAIVDEFDCKEVYVYAMGQEPWLNYVMSIKYSEESRPIIESNKLLTSCHAKGIIAERLFGEKEILLDQLVVPPSPETAEMAH